MKNEKAKLAQDSRDNLKFCVLDQIAQVSCLYFLFA